MAELLPHNKGKVPSYWTDSRGGTLAHDAVPHALAGNLPTDRVYATGTVEGEDLANHGLDPDGGIPDNLAATITGAVAGNPGYWEPLGVARPADLTAANALGLSLGAAWDTQGHHVLLGDGSMCYWNGTAFVAGAVGP